MIVWRKVETYTINSSSFFSFFFKYKNPISPFVDSNYVSPLWLWLSLYLALLSSSPLSAWLP